MIPLANPCFLRTKPQMQLERAEAAFIRGLVRHNASW
jgi:hypothetical protein